MIVSLNGSLSSRVFEMFCSRRVERVGGQLAMVFTDRLKKFERIHVLPEWQHASLRKCRQDESWNRWRFSFMEGLTVQIYVAGRRDCDSYCGDPFDIVFRAQDIFGEGQMDIGKVYGRHDGRNSFVQQSIHSGKWPGLVSCMVEVLVLAAEVVYRDQTTNNVRAMIWCESGRCPSFSAAMWLARVAQVMNLQFEVYLQRWNEKNVADKRCDCPNCRTPVGLHRFMVTEAEKVIDKLAEVAASGSVYSIWKGAWRKCSFDGDESMCRRVRWSAGNMLGDVLTLRCWCADATCDYEVLEIRNASRW